VLPGCDALAAPKAEFVRPKKVAAAVPFFKDAISDPEQSMSAEVLVSFTDLYPVHQGNDGSSLDKPS
jgi:hypothetical protein